MDGNHLEASGRGGNLEAWSTAARTWWRRTSATATRSSSGVYSPRLLAQRAQEIADAIDGHVQRDRRQVGRFARVAADALAVVKRHHFKAVMDRVFAKPTQRVKADSRASTTPPPESPASATANADEAQSVGQRVYFRRSELEAWLASR